MQQRELPAPHAKSAFAAAFLSFVFPGLGHAYAGAWHRALAFAAVPLLLLSLSAGLALHLGLEFLGYLVQPVVLQGLLVADVIGLVYRAVATVDAYQVTARLNAATAGGGGRLGQPRVRLHPVSLAGLLAVILVLAGGHVALAYRDMQALDFVSSVFDTGGATPTPATPSPGTTAPPSAAPAATIPPWNGKDRLNILLIGADQRPKDSTFNTDTLIVVSIDPVSRSVVMFSIPRDTVDIPLPPIPARAVYGLTYSNKINSIWTAAQSRPDLFPGGGYPALKQIMGYMYGINISYYVEVNFEGFKAVVDTLGGVTINVQIPVVDDSYPDETNSHERLYIPTGIQHMNGTEALAYARSRHGSALGDFDRAQRQQRVLVAIRQQANIPRIFANLDSLLTDLKSAVHTDIPVGTLPSLLDLSNQVGTGSITSILFTPPTYETEVNDPTWYHIEPNIPKIRAAVAAALAPKATPTPSPAGSASADPASEHAKIVVLNGSGISGQAGATAAYLRSVGLSATSSTQAPAQSGLTTTFVQAYNGSASAKPATAAFLARLFGVSVVSVTDSSVTADFVVTTGTATPALTPVPSGSAGP